MDASVRLQSNNDTHKKKVLQKKKRDYNLTMLL